MFGFIMLKYTFFSKPGSWKMAFIDSKYNGLMVYIPSLIYDYNAIKKGIIFHVS